MLPLLFLLPVFVQAASSSPQAPLEASSSTAVTVSLPSSAFSSVTSASASTSNSGSASAASASSILSSAASSATQVAVTTAATTTPNPVTTTTSPAFPPSDSVFSFSAFPTPSDPALPPIYPATDPSNPPSVDNSPGLGDAILPDFSAAWATAYAKAKAQIANYTLEQKVNVTTGVGWEGGRCVGNIGSVGNWSGLCLEDSPLGVRDTDFVTAFPAGINAASTFKRSLIRLRGKYMGVEHVGKGVNIALGPMMNMGRIAQGGRNWEGFGADPYLTGESAYETVLGLQSGGVQACAKHYINNEQEHKRTQDSAQVDDRTQHEIYAHPFLRSVMAGVASIMCSYNLINGTYACENNKMINDVLKREYGFQGFVMSDWSATMSTISAVAGLDMTMPGDITFNSGNSYFGGNLTAYVNNGTIAEARIDDMATRILASWYFLRQDSPDYPAVNFNAFAPADEATNEHIDVQGLSDTPSNPDAHASLVRQIGQSSAVLLKNVRSGQRWGGGSRGLPLGPSENAVNPYGRREDGINRKRKGGITSYEPDVVPRAATSTSSGKLRSLVMIGSDAGPGIIEPNGFSDQGGVDGTLAMGWGSGTDNFTYLVSPLEGIQRRARVDRTSVSWMLDDFNFDRAGNVAIQKGAALVFLQSDSGEDYITVDGNEGDRKNLTAWHEGDTLVQTVAAQNNNTIVVIHSVGPLILEPWIEHPNVTAVLWAGLPGTETGNSLADVLWGHYNPSGRLPYTIAKNASDYPAQPILGGSASAILDIPYTEQLLIDYRWFDAKNIAPRYEFGFGLSYTKFSYSSLKITKVSFDSSDDDDSKLENAWAAGHATPMVEGSSAALWLHRPAFKVSFTVTNKGPVGGTEIPQLYIHFPSSAGEPPSVLRGFTDLHLEPGTSQGLSLSLSRYDLSFWDVEAQGWKKPDGTIKLSVGASSRDFRLNGTIPL